MWCDCVMDHDKYEVCCLPRPQTRARKSLCNLRTLKLPFHSLYRQMKGSFWNYLERDFINGYKGIFHRKFGTFYAEVEVLGNLVSKERASSNHVHEFWSHFRQISVNEMLTQGHSSPLKILFLHLISYTKLLPFFKKAKVIFCRVKLTRLCFEFRRLHNDFLPQVWGRGRNRTTQNGGRNKLHH